MGITKTTELFLIGLFIFGALAMVPGTVINNMIFATEEGPDGGPAVTEIKVTADKACGSTTMTMDFKKKYSASTDLTAQNGTVFINGEEKGIFDEAGTFTAQGGDVLNVYYAIDPAQTTYYASHATGMIPCTGQTAAFATSADFMKAGENAGTLQSPPHAVYQTDATMTATIINPDNTLNSETGSNVTMSAGQTRKIKVTIYPTFEDGYGVAGGNTLACQFNDTVYDQAEASVSLDGKVLTSPATYVPSNTRFPMLETSNTALTWDVPAVDGAVSGDLNFVISIKADNDNAPTQGATTGGPDWNCTLFDTDLYQTDAGEVKVDVEDRDDNSNIGTTSDFAFNINVK